MKIPFALLISALLLSSAIAVNAPDEIITDRDGELVTSSLEKTIRKIDQSGKVKAWIFFTDKGFFTLSDLSFKLQQVENQLTEKARNRRLKARGIDNLVDFRDIPVYQTYIDKTLATGVQLRRVLRWFNAVTVEADQTQLEQIALFPFVRIFKHVSTARYPDDYVKEADSNGDVPMINSTLDYGMSIFQLEQINLVVAHELGFTGQDVLVCMMDTGYRQGHVSFQNIINEGRLIAQYDFINNDDNTDYDPDQDVENQPRHGTLTWSALGGDASGSLYGPAYGASFVLAKTEDITSEHHIEEDNWAAAAEWGDSIGIDVISASLGYRYDFDYPDEEYTYEDMNGDSTIVTQAADLAALNGITVATAQGNDGSLGPGSLLSPADGDSVLAIGAVYTTDEPASFTAQGPTYDGRIKPEVCACGVNTVCADPSNMNGFTAASGTSLSTPLSGGVAAVLLSAHPNWTPMMVREAMMMTATQANTPNNTYGWGILDVAKALYYHPEGDIIIEHEPIVYFPAGLDNIVVDAEISGGDGINSSEVYLYWRTDDTAPFTQVSMTTSDELHFEGIIPGLDEGYLNYYISAEDVNGIQAVYPYGAPDNYFTVHINQNQFTDSFEDGFNYWKTSGIIGQWSITAERAATGNISVTDSPYRDYHNDDEVILESNFSIPIYDTDTASVSFMTRYILQSNRDYVYFEISTDNGQTWEQINTPINGSRFDFAINQYDLQSYIGNTIRFRFRLTTDDSGWREGIHIDDFTVFWGQQVGMDDVSIQIPLKFSLNQNYPNPFNASTIISFNLNKACMTDLTVYDILGRKVKSLVSGEMPAGNHEIVWDGRDDSGNEAASGLYLYKLEAEGSSSVRRMTLLK